MILEGVIFVPRWSVTSGSIVVVVTLLFGLELLSQAKAVLHLVLVVLVEGAWSFKDLLVLLVVVMLGVGFTNLYLIDCVSFTIAGVQYLYPELKHESYSGTTLLQSLV